MARHPDSRSLTPSLTPAPAHGSSTACFYVQAKADPSVLPRTLEQFAKRGLIPSKWHSVQTGRRNDELHIDIQVDGMGGALTKRVAACLREIVYVGLVLTSEKHYAQIGRGV